MGARLAGWIRKVLVLVLLLPGGLTPAKDPPAAGAPRPTPRQAALAHFRAQQQAVRAYKQRQRDLRRAAAREAATEGAAAREAAAEGTKVREAAAEGAVTREAAAEGTEAREAAAGGTEAREAAAEGTEAREAAAGGTADPAGQASARRHRPAGIRPAGVACLALLGLAALADPALLATQAPGLPWNLPPQAELPAWLARQEAEVAARLDALGPICAAPELSGRNLVPCAPAYRAGILAQVRSLHDQVARLFVEPSVLGAGSCRPGEPKAQALERIEADQSDLEAAFSRVASDGAFLWYRLSELGFELQAVGTGFLAPGLLVLAAGAAPGSPATVPGFVLAETGHGLIALGFVFQAQGTWFGWIANRAGIHQARWQRWAIRQTPRLLNCTEPPGFTPVAGPAPPPPLAAPAPVLADTLQWLAEGCRVAARRGLALPVCAPEAFQEFQGRNGTLAGSYQAVACSSAGTLLGLEASCPQEPATGDEDQLVAGTYLPEYEGEVEDGAFPALAGGDALFAVAEGLVAAGDAAEQAGNGTLAAAFYADSDLAFAAGNGLYACGYAFFRMAAVGRAWQTLVTQDTNALVRARLDRAYAQGAAGTGPGGPAGGTGGETGTGSGPDPEAGPLPAEVPAAVPPAPGGPPGGPRGADALVASAAPRPRPALVWALLGWFRPGAAAPVDPPPDDRIADVPGPVDRTGADREL